MKKLFLALFSLSAVALLAGEMTVCKQFWPSVQAVSVPKGTKIDKVAVYIVKDKQADKEHPLPAKLIANADGTSRILFEVPGIGGNHGYAYCKIKDGIVYDNYQGPKKPPMLGPIQATIQIDLNAAAASPALNATDANLIYNGDLEKPNAKGDFADGFFWQGASQKGFREWLKGEGFQGTYGVKVHRTAAKGTAAFSETYFVQGGKTYTYGGHFKCDNPDKKYAIVYLQCFDKNNKPLHLLKGGKTYCYQKYVSADWGKFEKTVTIPAEAHHAQLGVQLHDAGPNNTIWCDNLYMKCEDLSF